MLALKVLDSLHTHREEPVRLRQTLNHLVVDERFVESPETKWAYDKVRSFLEDGGTAVAGYGEMQDYLENEVDKLFVVQIVNKVVGGCGDAVNKGEWPTPLDRAAFLFYHTYESPQFAQAHA